MPNVSLWFDQVPDQLKYPKLSQAAAADVVVVGAGLAGVLTAYQLAKAGKKVIVLEQNHVATGDSGFTTAFVSRVLDADIPQLAQRYGMPKLTAIYQTYTQAQQQLFDLVQQEQIECDFKMDPSQWYCTPADWAVIQQLDPQAKWVENYIEFAHEGSFHIRKFMLGLLNTAVGKQIKIFEETVVTAITPDAKKVLVTTSEGKVVAKQVIVTSGLPACFPELHAFFETQLTYVIAARYAGAAPLADGQFWDSTTPYHYWRKTDAHTIMLGGEDRASNAPQPTASPYDALTAWLHAKFPGEATDKATVTHTWSGSMFETEDGLPYVLPHPHHAKQVFVACGLSGNGMVGSAVAAQLLSSYVLETVPEQAKLFTLQRTGKKLPKPKVPGQLSTWLKWLLRIVLVAAYATALIMPAMIFFQGRGGVGFLQGLDAKTISSLLFPLVGLYAFTLVWAQFVLGSGMWLWRKVFGWIEPFHRTQGLFALLFAFLHPTMIAYGYGLELYLSRDYVAPEMQLYLYLGYFQLLLMVCTVLTAILRKRSFMKKIWRYVHFANYAVFASVWIHSWFLGSDVRFSNLKYLWIGYAVTAVFTTGLRLYDRFRPGEKVTASGAWVKAATTAQVQPGKAYLAIIGTKQLAMFNFNGKYYAIDNLCTHAGGPLCQGALSGSTVECPWHSSTFDITTGAVIDGPARRPQRSYPTKVEGDKVLVQL